MSYDDAIKERAQIISAQANMINALSDIPVKDLSSWEQDFRTSITQRMFNRRRELTPKQVSCVINILAWHRLDQS